MMRTLALAAATALFAGMLTVAQNATGNAGTITVHVNDPSSAAIPKASAQLLNRVTNFKQAAVSDTSGTLRFVNVPPASYHLQITAPGFANFDQDVDVRSPVPQEMTVQLQLGEARTTVEVEATDLLENVPYAHNDIDISNLSKLPMTSPGSGMSDAIILSNAAVVGDSDGFFHPLGDHAQTTFSIDGQPISDQQSKNFSTQLPLNVIQSMELITGAPPAEYGDKTSMVVNATTKSGIGQKPNGSILGQIGSFGTYSEEATFGFGSPRVGNFVAVNALRSGRFLDTPEWTPLHATGTNGTVFDRFDVQPTGRDSIHLNLFWARNWFQTPNTYDQLAQDQHSKNSSFNLAPSYQHTFGTNIVFTLNPFFRKDFINYYPSKDVFADSPATIAQHRTLANWGAKSDVSIVKGRHTMKFGIQAMQTRLDESFNFGVTDPGFNAVCVNGSGDPVAAPTVLNPAQCAAAGFRPNNDFLPGLLPFDLTRGGKLLRFAAQANINQVALYAQDAIKIGSLTLQAGLRFDHYDGFTTANGAQPRLGLSYQLKSTGTVLRASYSRTFETPYNENLILSSATGQGGLSSNALGVTESAALKPGNRNQYNAGFQQAFTKYLVVDADYFWKFTKNAYDFDSLFNSPVHFPISWRQSKIDGLAVRIATPNIHGFQWTTSLGHTRARFFGPEVGGLVFNSPVDASVFRIDHDQAFQQTSQVRYQRGHNGPWVSFTWRYDSGAVAGAISSLEDVLQLTGAQQMAIGLSCGGSLPTVVTALSARQCTPANYQTSRLVIPAEGKANPDTNPARIAPRNLLDLGFGTDNLFHKEHYRTILRFAITNLTNKEALYNFLSTFSGTHFVEPRAYQVAIGFNF